MKRKTIAEILQAEIAKVGSIKAVSRETELPYSVVHKIAGGGDCQVTTAQVLLDYFGYRLTKTPPRKTKAATKRSRRKV